MSYFNLILEYTDDMNISIQRFENTLGHGVRSVDNDVNETIVCTIYPTPEWADSEYNKAVDKAKKTAC